MGVNRLQGTPWHTEQVHRAEDDDRRHKTRCKNYIDDSGQCSRRNGKCIGSAHCMEYDVMTEEEFNLSKQISANPRKKSAKTTASGISINVVFIHR